LWFLSVAVIGLGLLGSIGFDGWWCFFPFVAVPGA
jgi:hypothetical protein